MSTDLQRSSRRHKVVTTDELRKSSIKSAVRGAREALAEGFKRRLALLGIFTDGKRLAREAVADQWTAQRDRPGVEAALARWEQQGFDATGAVERFIREASYTWLNRLSAIRALEVRGLIRAIANLDEGGTRPAIVATLAEVSPALYEAQEAAEALLWQEVFQELALQLGALFDPLDPHGLFPDSTAVLGALRALAQLDDATWREDDTLGWLYQFFTTKDERAALRKKKGVAFTADDLGPINQFYTPGWIVRFLTDNTLGALWRRMKPDTKIGEFCKMLLPATDDDTRVSLKRVREVKIIDPACGAMHFGVYAFDVLRQMYEEEGIENPRDVPRLILEQNLAGIDIDRRAIQIAALNLYLKAAVVLRELGEHEPPRDLHLNLGCADAAPPSGEQQAKLRAEIADPALREAVDVALSSLKYLHAVGSLLDVEADVRAALAKKTKVLPKGISPLPGLLAQVGMIEDAEPTQLDALVTRAREVAEAALRSDDVAGALVAEDAMLAAKVLRLVNQRYDVVLMNPPYGELMPPATKQYLHQRYPKSKSDIYGAFFELAFRLAEGGGAVGALTSKTFLYLDTFKHVREFFLKTGRMSALIDGGTGILFESFVPVGASTVWAAPSKSNATSFVFRVVHSQEPDIDTETMISQLRSNLAPEHGHLYRPLLADLRRLPTETIAYWAPPALLTAYEKYPPLEQAYGEVRVGLQSGNDERFLRYWWEVPEHSIGEGKRWVPFAKGGDYYPYYESLLHVIDWRNNGAEIKASPAARPQNQSYYFRKGITFPRTADRFHARLLTDGAIFGDSGPCIFGRYSWPLLGYLNSKVAQALLMVQSTTRKFEVGQVRRLCVPSLDSDLGSGLAKIARDAVIEAEKHAEGDELDRRFRASWMDGMPTESFAATAQKAALDRVAFWNVLLSAQEEATILVSEQMGFTAFDWAQIERALGPELRVDENVKSVGTVKTTIDPLTTPEEQARRHLSALCHMAVSEERILLGDRLISKVCSQISSHFTAGDPIKDCASLLKMTPSHWCETQFHEYHLSLRRGRPRVVKLSTTHRKLQVFIDLVVASTDDLRNFIAAVVESLESQTRAQLAAAISAPKKLDLQESLEDCAQFKSIVHGAISGWADGDADARSRLTLLKPLVGYVKA